MVVFDAEIKVPTRVAQWPKDRGIPDPGPLPTAGLEGAASTDMHSVHGTHHLVVDQAAEELFKATLLTTVQKACMLMLEDTWDVVVDRDVEHKFRQKFRRSVLGQEFTDNHGEVIRTFAQKLLELHAEQRILSEPQEKLQFMGQEFIVTSNSSQATGSKKQMTGFDLALRGVVVEMTGMERTVKLLPGQVSPAQMNIIIADVNAGIAINANSPLA